MEPLSLNEMTNECFNKISTAEIDPFFIENILNFRGSLNCLDNFWSLSTIEDQKIKKTDFQIQLPLGQAKNLWPDEKCLISIYIHNNDNCVRRLMVWQGRNFLICAVCESSFSSDVIAGSFLSSDDVFALDHQSELHAMAYHRLAKNLIVKNTVEVLSPLASYDFGLELGIAMAKKLTTSSAERFLDGLTEALLSKVLPKKAREI